MRNQSKQRSYRDKSKTRKNKLIATEHLLYFQVNRTLVFLKLLHGYGEHLRARNKSGMHGK